MVYGCILVYGGGDTFTYGIDCNWGTCTFNDFSPLYFTNTGTYC